MRAGTTWLEQTEIATLPVVMGEQPIAIAKRAMDTGRREGYDVVILDTAGRVDKFRQKYGKKS